MFILRTEVASFAALFGVHGVNDHGILARRLAGAY
jgi:hypothetical protein